MLQSLYDLTSYYFSSTQDNLLKQAISPEEFSKTIADIDNLEKDFRQMIQELNEKKDNFSMLVERYDAASDKDKAVINSYGAAPTQGYLKTQIEAIDPTIECLNLGILACQEVKHNCHQALAAKQSGTKLIVDTKHMKAFIEKVDNLRHQSKVTTTEEKSNKPKFK